MTYVGLDLGTTKIAALLLDAGSDAGPPKILRTISRDHHATLPATNSWEHAQDADVIFNLSREVLKQLVSGSDAPSALCVTGQVHGILYTDADGRAVSPLYTWLDARSGQPLEHGSSSADVLSRESGSWVPVGYGAGTHLYNQRNGIVPDAARRCCTLPEYVTARLTGSRRFVCEAGLAATVGLFDLARLEPDQSAFHAAGLDDLRWGEVVPSDQAVGNLDLSGAGRTVVVPPIGDNQAGFIGAVRDTAHAALVNVGTGGQVSVHVPRRLQLDPPLELRPFPRGGYLAVGASLCGGKAYAALASFYRQVIETFAPAGFAPITDAVLYERMNEIGASIRAGSDGSPRVDTRFQGTRADGSIRGALSNLSLTSLTPAEVTRGFVTGIATELYDYFRRIPVERGHVQRIVAAGNAVRKNPLLRSEIGRLFGVAPAVPTHQEETALGAALNAAAAQSPGAYESASRVLEYTEN